MCPIGRCQPCNALYNRVRNNIRRVDQWVSNAWNNTDKDNKADFIRSCRALTSFELNARIKQFISREQQSMITTSLCGTGRFLDKHDLQLKYDDKPYQLKHILENANMFVDFVRDLPLYEDMEYQSGLEAVETRRKRTIQKAMYRARKKLKAGTNSTLAGDASKITKKQSQQLDTCLKFLEAAGKALQRLKTAMTDLGQWIAPAFNDRLNGLQVRHESIQALYDEIKQTGECLDFNGFIANMSAFKEGFDSEQADFAWYVQERFKDSIASVDLPNKSEKGGKAAKKK